MTAMDLVVTHLLALNSIELQGPIITKGRHPVWNFSVVSRSYITEYYKVIILQNKKYDQMIMYTNHEDPWLDSEMV